MPAKWIIDQHLRTTRALTQSWGDVSEEDRAKLIARHNELSAVMHRKPIDSRPSDLEGLTDVTPSNNYL